VAWVRVDTQTILSIHHNVITQNPRISLTYNDHRSWYLHIREVEESDRGWYMCQVNTDPMRSRKGYLQVVGKYGAMINSCITPIAGLVAWVRVDTQTILSIHHNVITQNPRISLTYNDHRSWYLHIREVEESDRGWYMCQVNTDPMRSRKGYLQVVVPPAIIESMTSNDMVVREGTNVTLNCKAKGFPEPYVMWRREDGDEMAISGENVNVVDGEILHITKVSRLHMAAYLCVASNGVPPSISKRVQLRVQFPPMLSIPNQLEGAYVGQDVVLECHTEAYPASINYWTTERGDMIISGEHTETNILFLSNLLHWIEINLLGNHSGGVPSTR
uniref:Ig-like domain-containing protein n=1 Tax=Anopheles quadriannulatus TaxID=34691 RepID=A0A182X631_ANOQN